MDQAVIACQEEEFGPFFSLLWRWGRGWRPVFLYARGPAGIPFLLAPLLTLCGLWRFARKPRRLSDHPDDVLKAKVVKTDCLIGSYGMGGPGFLGLKVRKRRGPSCWIVLRLWGADGWITINGAVPEESLFPAERAALQHRQLIPLSVLLGSELRSVDLSHDAVQLIFQKEAKDYAIRLTRKGDDVHPFRGNGQPKRFTAHERVSDAVVISRRARIWLA